jgi:hypothetical protein
MFSAFHRFRPDAARAILKNAFDLRSAICIFEAGPDGLVGAAIAVGFPFHVLVLIPFVRPFRWAYLVFTYLVPLMPLILLLGCCCLLPAHLLTRADAQADEGSSIA